MTRWALNHKIETVSQTTYSLLAQSVRQFNACCLAGTFIGIILEL